MSNERPSSVIDVLIIRETIVAIRDGHEAWRLLTGADYADDAVTVDADAISGVGPHGDGLVVAMTWWSSW